MEKIIFLDVDGVLNHKECWKHRPALSHPSIVFGKECVEQLNRIIKETNAKLVISSTWRLYKDHYDALVNEEISGIKGEFIGETPDLLPDITRETSRGLEIKEWLKEFGEPCKFIILDDDSDMDDLIDHLLQTDFMGKGLTKEIADFAISILNIS